MEMQILVTLLSDIDWFSDTRQLYACLNALRGKIPQEYRQQLNLHGQLRKVQSTGLTYRDKDPYERIL